MFQDTSNIDLSAEIREANALAHQLAPLGTGELRMLTGPEQPVMALLRSETSDARRALAPVVVLINSDVEQEHPVPIPLHLGPPLPGERNAVSAPTSPRR